MSRPAKYIIEQLNYRTMLFKQNAICPHDVIYEIIKYNEIIMLLVTHSDDFHSSRNGRNLKSDTRQPLKGNYIKYHRVPSH